VVERVVINYFLEFVVWWSFPVFSSSVLPSVI